MNRLAVIALGGVLGSLARYVVSLLMGPWDGGWPWATMTVNLVGCLSIGVIATLTMSGRSPDWVRPFAITGVLGGFTTFSAFALETGLLLEAGQALTAGLYVAVTMVVGLAAVRLGGALTGGTTP